MSINVKQKLIQQLLYEIAKTPCSSIEDAHKATFMMNVIDKLNIGIKES